MDSEQTGCGSIMAESNAGRGSVASREGLADGALSTGQQAIGFARSGLSTGLGLAPDTARKRRPYIPHRTGTAAAAGGFGVSRGPSFLLQAPPAAVSGAAAPEVAAKHKQPIRTLHGLGAQLYQTMGCSGCHSVNGAPGVGPTWKNLAGYPQKLANGQTANADYQFLRTMILDPGKIDLAGFPQGVMPNTYRAMLTGKVHPHETRLNALIWYINTLSDRRSKASQPPVPDSLRQARFTTQAGG